MAPSLAVVEGTPRPTVGGGDKAGLGWVSSCPRGGVPRLVSPYFTALTRLHLGCPFSWLFRMPILPEGLEGGQPSHT